MKPEAGAKEGCLGCDFSMHACVRVCVCVCVMEVEYSGGRTRLMDDLHTYYVCMITSGLNQRAAAEAQYKTITRAVSGQCHYC